MALEHVGNTEITAFAKDRVNLPKEKADEYRKQVRNLTDRLENYIGEHPDFELKRLMLSGSLAKGTALRSLNDIDVACYISGANTPKDVQTLLKYLIERLRKAFPNFSPDQIHPNTYSVTVSFRGSGLDVDIVPILYAGESNWYGNLVNQEDGSYLRTSIPRHLEFIGRRKTKHPTDYAQVIRLLKFWSANLKDQNDKFRFKSFMIELILAKLSDGGVAFANYIDAMQEFFTYIVKSDIKELIYFEDYYSRTVIPSFTNRVRIIDPVNEKNNVAALYTESEARMIIDAANDAGDAIDSAIMATTKGQTIAYWQKVFGSIFSA